MLKEEFEKLGRNIKYYRTQKGLSCAKLAHILHKQERILEEIEAGKRIFQLRTLEKIANALEVPVDKFLDFERKD
ncbi:MAG: helix-turn-helix domain-containing protein [Candidatus Gastranaerophilaceae bacterium]